MRARSLLAGSRSEAEVSAPSVSAGSVQVCHLTTAHSADDSRVFWRECVGLASRGYAITLAARADADEIREGVRIIALRSYRRRAVRMSVGVARAFAVALRSRAQIVHLHDPELIPLVVPLRLLGKRVVYDAHEWLSRQVAAKEYLPRLTRGLAVRAARGLEFLIGRIAHRIVTVNEACASAYPAAKVTVVANYPDVIPEQDASQVDPARLGAEPPKVVYVGGISVARGIREVMAALELASATTPLRLRLLGRFAPATLQDELGATPGWRRVDYLGMVPHREVADRLTDAVAGLSTLHPTPNHLISSPVKVFEYMAAGLPVILSDFPHWRALLSGVDCAVWVDPGDPQAISRAMLDLALEPERRRALGANGRRAVVERFNWGTQLDNLTQAYAALLG